MEKEKEGVMILRQLSDASSSEDVSTPNNFQANNSHHSGFKVLQLDSKHINSEIVILTTVWPLLLKEKLPDQKGSLSCSLIVV